MAKILKGHGFNITKKMTKKEMVEILKGYGIENNMSKTEMVNVIEDYGYNVPKNISTENLEKVIESGSGYGMNGYGFYKSPHKFKKLSKRQIKIIMRGGGDPMAAMMAWGRKVGQDMHNWGRQAEADMNAWGRKVEADMNAWGRQAEARLRQFGNDVVRTFNDPEFQIKFLEAIALVSEHLATAFSFIPGVGQVISAGLTALNIGAELVAQNLKIKEAEKEAFKAYVVAEAQARQQAEASLKALFEQKVAAFLEIMKATNARKQALAEELGIPVADVSDPVKVVAARANKAARLEAERVSREAARVAAEAEATLAEQLGISIAESRDPVKLEAAIARADLAEELGISIADARDPVKVAAARTRKAQELENALLFERMGISIADSRNIDKLRAAWLKYYKQNKCEYYIGAEDEPIPDLPECRALIGTPRIQEPGLINYPGVGYPNNNSDMNRVNRQFNLVPGVRL